MFKKLVISLVCVIALLGTVLSFAACGSNEHEQEIVNLNQSIDELNKNVAYLLEQNKVLKREIADLKDVLGLPDYDFSDHEVVVEIKEEYRERIFTVDDFSMLSVSKVSLLSQRLNIYVLEITNKGKLNVLEAIKKLEEVDFVKTAYPNIYETFAMARY